MDKARKNTIYDKLDNHLFKLLILKVVFLFYLGIHYGVCFSEKLLQYLQTIFVYTQALNSNQLYFSILMPIWLFILSAHIALMVLTFKYKEKFLTLFIVSMIIDILITLGIGAAHSLNNQSVTMIVLAILITIFYMLFSFTQSLPMLRISNQIHTLRNHQNNKDSVRYSICSNITAEPMLHEHYNTLSMDDEQREKRNYSLNLLNNPSTPQESNVTSVIRKFKLDKLWKMHHKKSNDSLYYQFGKSYKDSNEDIREVNEEKHLDIKTQLMNSITHQTLLSLRSQDSGLAQQKSNPKIISIATDSELDDKALFEDEESFQSPQFKLVSTSFMNRHQNGSTFKRSLQNDYLIGNTESLLIRLTQDSSFRKEWIQTHDIHTIFESLNRKEAQQSIFNTEIAH